MIHVSLATPADMRELIDLFHQADVHYFANRASAKPATARYVRRNLFQPHCGVRVALAREGSRPLGFASFAILYPAPSLSGQLFMKDLFTVKEARGKGAGSAIIQFLAKLAVGTKCGRFDWTAESTNPKALEFYDHLGIPRVNEKVYFRLDGDLLRKFAKDRRPTSARADGGVFEGRAL